MADVRREIREVLDRVRGQRLAIVGDVCSDEWVAVENRHKRHEVGCAKRVEARGLVRATGMAGLCTSVCHLLGVGVHLFAVPIQMSHCVRTRYHQDGKALLRVDENPNIGQLEQYRGYRVRMREELQECHALDAFDALLIADYGYGCFGPGDREWWVKWAQQAGVFCIVDPDRHLAGWGPYQGADVIKANHHECKTGGRSWDTVVECVVTTQAEAGCYMLERTPTAAKRTCSVPGWAVKSPQTVGAGDAFAAGLAASWGLDDLSPGASVRFANAVAAWFTTLEMPGADFTEPADAADKFSKWLTAARVRKRSIV